MYYLLHRINYMFRHYSLAIFRLINEKFNKQLHSICVCCKQWGGKRWGWYEIWHALCRVGVEFWYFFF